MRAKNMKKSSLDTANPIKVLCINPGYSLIRHLDLYKTKKYQAHLLYGVNGLEKWGLKPVFEEDYKENVSQLKSNWRSFLAAKRTDCDCIYVPFIDWGIIIAIGRKIGLIKKPVVALAHGYKKHATSTSSNRYKKAIVNGFRKIVYKCPDKLIFISKYAFEEYIKENTKSSRVGYLSLQPEIMKMQDDTPSISLLSVGKTNRDYKPVLEFGQEHTECRVCVIGYKPEKSDCYPGNIQFVDKFMYLDELEKYYRSTEIVLVPVQETNGGVYGLSSLLDAISFCKPILVSKTEGLEIDVESEGIGETYECGNCDEFADAYDKLKKEYHIYVSNIDEYVKRFNNDVFCKSISEQIVESTLAYYSAKSSTYCN